MHAVRRGSCSLACLPHTAALLTAMPAQRHTFCRRHLQQSAPLRTPAPAEGRARRYITYHRLQEAETTACTQRGTLLLRHRHVTSSRLTLQLVTCLARNRRCRAAAASPALNGGWAAALRRAAQPTVGRRAHAGGLRAGPFHRLTGPEQRPPKSVCSRRRLPPVAYRF